MKIDIQKLGPLQIYKLFGRLDTAGSQCLEQNLDTNLTENIRCVLLDMHAMDYISSAGLRVILVLSKKLKATQGELGLIRVGDYCMELLKVTGFADAFPIYKTTQEADRLTQRFTDKKKFSENWDILGERDLQCGTVKVMPIKDGKTAVTLHGDINDILNARVTAGQIAEMKLSDIGYAFGIGALGKDAAACMPALGHIMTTGRAISWLPTDGADTADMLLVQSGQGHITLKTAYHVALDSGFDELLYFQSAKTDGTDLSTLFRALFKMAKTCCPGYKGLLAVCMRANVQALYGVGIKRPPVKENTPKDGKAINHANHAKAWFTLDESPRLNDVTALIIGVGLNLMDDLSDFDETVLSRMFPLNPIQLGGKSELLMLYGASYGHLAMPDKPVNLEKEIEAVLTEGQFLDMRQLDVRSTIKQALIGIGYVNDCKVMETAEENLKFPHRPSPPASARKAIINAYRKAGNRVNEADIN